MTKQQQDYYKYRLLEILPGALVWLTFVFTIVISYLAPLWGIYFVIAFDVYWVLRILYMMIFLIISWWRYQTAIKIDWLIKLKTDFPNYKEYYHLIFLPTAGEPYEVVEDAFKNLLANQYDQQKMIVILGGEARYQDQFRPIADKILAKYKAEFYKIIVTIHPQDLPGEVPGKGSNMYHQGHEAKKYIDEQGFDYKKLIVSAFDIDTSAHPLYFAHLTYKFLSHPNPYRASFQPMAFYHNNVWESDIITRVVANSTTFWLMTDLARPDRLFTFSSHSMSWTMLVDVGFWQNNIVTEDSRIFLQGLIRYDGDYRTEPMYIPVSMNTVCVGNLWRNLKNQYKQMRRWAWGVEHFPYMVWLFRQNPKISFGKKMRYIWNQTEGVYSWATAPLIIFIMGRLPLYVAEKYNMTSVLTQNAPLLLEKLMRFGMIGIFIIAIMSVVILPPIPKGDTRSMFYKFYKYLMMFAQWLIFPFTMILFGSIPAIDAQTRMMTGRYLGFWVTEKKKLS